mgnify:FL=1
MPRLGALLAHLGDRCLHLAELVDPLDLPPLDTAAFVRRLAEPAAPPAVGVPGVYLNAGAFYAYTRRAHV